MSTPRISTAAHLFLVCSLNLVCIAIGVGLYQIAKFVLALVIR